MKRLISFFILISVFLDSAIFIREPINLFLYYVFYVIFLALFLLKYKTLKFNKTFFQILLLTAIVSVSSALFSGSNLVLVFKQLFAVSFSSLTFYIFIVYNNYDVEYIYKRYLDLAIIVCSIGLIQEFSYIIGFKTGYDYSYLLSYWNGYVTEFKYYMKVNSIVSEPSHLAIALSPALFTSIDRFLNHNSLISKPKAACIIVTYFLTGSALALFSIIVSLLLLVFKYSFFNVIFSKKYILYTMPLAIICISTIFMIYQVPFIKFRVDDSIALFTAKNTGVIAKDLNLSTFSIYSNFLVAKESFLNNPLFGSGLGTHAANYDKYIGQYFDHTFYGVKIEVNKEDGSALWIRLLSELGVFGLIIFIAFLIKNKISYSFVSIKNYNLWLINTSILVFFILKTFRHGNYSLLGFFLFAFLYYFTHLKNKQIIASSLYSPNKKEEEI